MKTGNQLRDEGIERSLSTANSMIENWADKAYDVLVQYIETTKEFMTEDLRKYSESYIEVPHSTRAWGGIMVRACKEGLIERIGFKNVSNPRAHSTPATLWKVV